MWPPVRPTFCSMSGGPEDLGVDDGGVDVGAEAGEGIESEVADFVAAFVPGAVSKFVGDILRKDAHGVLAGGDDGGVVHALEVELAPEMLREFAAARCGEAGLPFVFGERSVDLAVVVGLIRCRGAR